MRLKKNDKAIEKDDGDGRDSRSRLRFWRRENGEPGDEDDDK